MMTTIPTGILAATPDKEQRKRQLARLLRSPENSAPLAELIDLTLQGPGEDLRARVDAALKATEPLVREARAIGRGNR